MNRKWTIASILIVVLLLICGASLFAAWQGIRMVKDSGISLSVQSNRFKAEGSEEKTLNVSGPVTLSIDNDFGDITVNPGMDRQVFIKADKSAWGPNEAEAQKMLERLTWDLVQDGNMIKISAHLPEPDNVLTIGPVNGGISYTITVPAETSVTVTSTNGDLSLTGTTGDVDLQTDFGSIDVSHINGKVSAKTKNGNITTTDINSKGDVSMSSEFGNLTAQRINGANVSVGSTNGTIDINDVEASSAMKTGSDFGGISLANSQASTLEIRSTNGKIGLENVGVEGTLTVNNGFGDLTLNRVNASAYDLQTQNGKINVDQAHGPITARSDFGDIEARNVENGTIDLTSKNGAITFSGSLAEGPHKVSSDFGNISLTLPADTALNVDLKTDFGKISSDFELTVSGALENNHWVGKFNGGGSVLTVETKNGNITINSK